jgi:hypothetical protein
MHSKAVGYHAFNLYALALLRQRVPAHPFWESEPMRRALVYAGTISFAEGLEGNPYGFPYNPAGFEVAFALHVFLDDTRDEQEHWVSKQLQRTYDDDEHMLSRNTDDPVTLSARLYEATRLPNLDIRGANDGALRV